MSTFGGEALPGNAAGYYALGLAVLIPGYLGYANRDARRQADREWRKYIVARIRSLKGLLAEYPAQGGDRELSVDSIRRLDELEKEMEEAGTGLENFFNAGDLSETEVDAIYAYDRKIVDLLEEMERNGPDAAADEWNRKLDELKDLADQRTRAIETVKA